MAVAAVWAESAYNVPLGLSIAQRALPSQGPGAAPFNPAFLGETHRAYLYHGVFLNTADNDPDEAGFWQGAAAQKAGPLAIAEGLGALFNQSDLPSPNAVVEDMRFTPGFALAYPDRNRGRFLLSSGFGMPIYFFNTFNAVKS